MKKLIIAALLVLSSVAYAQCQPKEAEGTGSTIRRAAEPMNHNAVIAWTCPDGKITWLGIRDSAQHLALPRTAEAIRWHLLKLEVWHAHDRYGMSDLAYMVPLAK